MLIIFSYDISMEQIEALISVSEFCEQRVENNCTTNQLTGFSWWLDRNGNQLQYWHGDGDESTLGNQVFNDSITWSTRTLVSQSVRKPYQRMPMLFGQLL